MPRCCCARPSARGATAPTGELGAVAVEMALVSMLLLVLIFGAFKIGSALFARHLLLDAASSVARLCALQRVRAATDCVAMATQCAEGGFSPACDRVQPWCDAISANVEPGSFGQGTAGPNVQWMNVVLSCSFKWGLGGELGLQGLLDRFTVSALMPYSPQPEVNP